MKLNLTFYGRKVNNVKKAAAGNKNNLWKAVKVAKNLSVQDIPPNLTLGGKTIAAGI